MLRSLHNPSPPPPSHYVMMLSFAWQLFALSTGRSEGCNFLGTTTAAGKDSMSYFRLLKQGGMVADVGRRLKFHQTGRKASGASLKVSHWGSLICTGETSAVGANEAAVWLHSELCRTVLCSGAILYLFWRTNIKAPAQWAITKIMRSYLQMSVWVYFWEISRLQIYNIVSLSHWLKRLEMELLWVVT